MQKITAAPPRKTAVICVQKKKKQQLLVTLNREISVAQLGPIFLAKAASPGPLVEAQMFACLPEFCYV